MSHGWNNDRRIPPPPPPPAPQVTTTDEERDYIANRRALYRKVVDCLDGCGLSVSAAAGVLRDVMSQMIICQRDEPVEYIIEKVKSSRFYKDS